MSIVSCLANLFNHWSKYRVLDVSETAKYVSKNLNKTYAVGILEDWFSTSDIIFKDGKTVPNAGPQISSPWGTPVLYVVEDNIFIATWRYSDHALHWSSDSVVVI